MSQEEEFKATEDKWRNVLFSSSHYNAEVNSFDDKEMDNGLNLPIKYYNKVLLNKMIIVWKRNIRKLKHQKILEIEHKTRVDRISNLVSNLSVGIDSSNKTKLNEIEIEKKRIESEKINKINKNKTSVRVSTHSPKVRKDLNLPIQGHGINPNLLIHKLKLSEKSNSKDIKINNNNNNNNDIDSISLTYSSEEDDLDPPSPPRSPPPPPYIKPDHTLQQANVNLNVSRDVKALNKPFRNYSHRHDSKDREINTKIIENNNNNKKKIPLQAPLLSKKDIDNKPPTPPIDLDSRFAERKEKLSALRKQAEERVAKRNLENNQLNKKKEQIEDEALDKLRDEKRLQLEKLKIDSLREKERQNEKLNLLQQHMKKSEHHYQSQLIIHKGFTPWLRLMEISRMNYITAANFRDDVLLQSTWIAFYGYIMMMQKERARKLYRLSSLALAFYRRNLCRKIWKGWVLYRKMLKAKSVAVTGQFSRYTIGRRSFRAWRVSLERVRRAMVVKMNSVIPRGNICCMKYYFKCWNSFIENRLIDREIKYRTDATWAKVQSWMHEI